MFAYELYISSPQLEEKLWRRLLTISVEDIGMGNPLAAVVVNALSQARLNFDYADNDRTIYFIHAIRYMCQSEKDRSSDLLKNICIKRFAMGKLPEIPDYALDKHTQRGQAMGRDSFHFLNEMCIRDSFIAVSMDGHDAVGVLIDDDTSWVHTERAHHVLEFFRTVDDLALVELIGQVGEDVGRQFHTHTDIHSVALGPDVQGITDLLHPLAAASAGGDDALLSFKHLAFAGNELIRCV